MKNLQINRYVDAIARTGSIRKASEQLSITPSALNRRILALEEELDIEIFERHSKGMRLNNAGKLLIELFRNQLADVAHLQSQLAELSDMRVGNVSIVCSQALLPYFLPSQIKRYQNNFPGVTFDIKIGDGEKAAQSLLDFSADLALVFEPLKSLDSHTIVTVKQPINAVMSKNHPLAEAHTLKFNQCHDYPLALPSQPYAVRHMLELAADSQSRKLQPTVEAESYIFLRNFVMLQENAISFEIQIGVPSDQLGENLISVPLILPGVQDGLLHLAQMRSRTLPLAAARFADQLSTTFSEEFQII